MRRTSEKIAFLRDKLTPQAFDLLRQHANDFLVPCWQCLSLELEEQRFAAEAPGNHRSFTAFKALDWDTVISSVQQETDWQKQPVLLFRYAEGCFKAYRESESIMTWFRFFMFFPNHAERQILETANYLLLSDWHHFNDLDPELETELFPAWLILKKPALAKLHLECASGSPNADVLRLVCNLANVLANRVNSDIIKLGTDLRQRHPKLFCHYMAANQ